MRAVVSILIAVVMVACGEDEPAVTRYVAPPAPCALADEGEFRCAGAVLQQCQNTKWTTNQNCLPGTCNSATLSCEGGGGCTAGDMQCSANSVQTCNMSGTWDTTQSCDTMTCVQAGTTASCQASCTSGDQQCLSNTVQTCGINGWVDTTACGAMTCVETDETTAACQTVACTPGNTRCNGNTLQTCSDGWLDTSDCTGQTCVQTSATTAACQSTGCTTGNQQCVANSVQTCVGGDWTTTMACGAQTCVQSGTTASCEGESNPCSACTGECYICDGSQVVACNGTTGEVWYDCGDFLGDNTVVGWCYDFGGSWGADCVVPSGTDCLFSAGEGTLQLACGTSSGPSASLGCEGNAGCTTASACTPATTYAVNCSGNQLFVDCHPEYSQAVLLDCGNYNGVCTTFGEGLACVSSTSTTGDPCIPGLIECAPATHYCDPELRTCQLPR